MNIDSLILFEKDAGAYLLRLHDFDDEMREWIRDDQVPPDVAQALAQQIEASPGSISAFSPNPPLKCWPSLGFLVTATFIFGTLGALALGYPRAPNAPPLIPELQPLVDYAFAPLTIVILALGVTRLVRFKLKVNERLWNKHCFHCGCRCITGDEPLGSLVVCPRCNARNLVYRINMTDDPLEPPEAPTP